MSLIAKTQLQALFNLLTELKDTATVHGSTGEQTVIAADKLAALSAEADRLLALDQQLLLGTHEHKHGDSTYLFLVPAGSSMSEEQFEKHLQEEFEPDRGEFLTVESIDSPEVLTAEDLQA